MSFETLFRPLGLAALVVVTLVATPSAVQATVITFEAIDLEDVAPGSDLWQYRYLVSERVFDPFQGFTIFFDPAIVFEVDTAVTPPNADWDVLVLSPGAPVDGYAYDALTFTAGPSLADEFVVNFVRAAGAGVPGMQDFAVNAFDESFNFLGVLETGTTSPSSTAPVPEPATLLLVGAGLAGLTLKTRRGRSR